MKDPFGKFVCIVACVGLAITALLIGLEFSGKKFVVKEEVTESTLPSLRTIDCTSLSGTKVTFNIEERVAEGHPSIVNYYARDQNGLSVSIDSNNYAQWKCQYDLP